MSLILSPCIFAPPGNLPPAKIYHVPGKDKGGEGEGSWGKTPGARTLEQGEHIKHSDSREGSTARGNKSRNEQQSLGKSWIYQLSGLAPPKVLSGQTPRLPVPNLAKNLGLRPAPPQKPGQKVSALPASAYLGALSQCLETELLCLRGAKAQHQVMGGQHCQT